MGLGFKVKGLILSSPYSYCAGRDLGDFPTSPCLPGDVLPRVSFSLSLYLAETFLIPLQGLM